MVEFMALDKHYMTNATHEAVEEDEEWSGGPELADLEHAAIFVEEVAHERRPCAVEVLLERVILISRQSVPMEESGRLILVA
jgi:hypothetical protein